MKIKKLTLGELSANCYLVFDEKSNEGIIIDPGDEANYIGEEILSLNFKPVAIIATHGHFDHLLAANELQLAFNIPFLIHKKDLFLVKRMKETAQYFLKRKIIESPPKKINFITENDDLPCQLKIIWTPGHTPGGICLYSKMDKILFSGDTLFAEGVGRTDFSYSSSIGLLKSLDKLSRLPQEIKIYPGHGRIFLKETLPQII